MSTAPAGPAIRVAGLAKRYGALEAVRGIDLEVRAGEIFGLIGPDGAGKTSTFQVLGGVMEATAGTAELLGRPARQARSYVGYLTQAFSLYPDLSVEENLRYVGELRLVPRAEIERRGRRYLEMFGLARFGRRLAGRLSGGMKQKMALACALVAEPRVLLLDEPTTGVDPVSRREFWDALVMLSSQGMTILVATPYLDEAERCHRVALMHQGRLVRTGTPAEIRDGLGLARLEVRAPDLRAALTALSGRDGGIADVQRFGDRLDVMVRDPAEGEREVRAALEAAGQAATSLRVGAPTLENAFVSILQSLEGEARAPAFPGASTARPDPGAVAIGARGLGKSFGDFVAVKDVDLEVRPGEVYGLLGANGAGKTTTIKMLCGLLEPSVGEVQLAGERGALRSEGVRQQVGYMSQKFSLYDDLTIDENLDFFAGVYQVEPARREERKRWVLDFAGLVGRGAQLTGSLPGGWKQRVAFGAAIMHEPRVLFLDEPTSGVDPIARRAFWTMINRVADGGTAVLVTTHYLEEAEQCNRLGFMVGGELVAEGTPSGIKAAQGGRVLEIRVDDPPRAIALLRNEREPWRVSLFGDRIHVIVEGDATEAARGLSARLEAGGVRTLGVTEQDFSLEDVFILIVERNHRGEDAAAAA
ncbi:MAG TPA: ATP-binding cassette domain-containing protein [Verrucomicrobiae bacterium]|jgi:ABC-2 type transport system ATP-binding protein|nr:ATP-binding cassette domain-containing protein [Verrucomicrobiae bacterium]